MAIEECVIFLSCWHLNSLLAGYFFFFLRLLSADFFFKINFFKKFFQEHYQSVKRFGSRSVGPDLGPNCLQRFYSRRQKLPLARKELLYVSKVIMSFISEI